MAETRRNPAQPRHNPGGTELAKAWNPADPSGTRRSGRNPAEPGGTRRNPAEPGGNLAEFFFQNSFQLNCQLSTACLRGGGCLSSFALKSRSTQPTCPVQCAGAGRWRPLTVSLAGAKSDNENPVCTWCLEVIPAHSNLEANNDK